MSINWEHSCSEFFYYLTNSQKIKVKSDILYMRGRIAYSKKQYNNAKVNLSYVLHNGKNMLVIKSFYMLLIIYIKKLIQN